MRVGREARGALLADSANTLRELVDLVKKKVKEKTVGQSNTLALFEKQSIATHVNLRLVSEPRDNAGDRSEQLNPRKRRSQSATSFPCIDEK